MDTYNYGFMLAVSMIAFVDGGIDVKCENSNCENDIQSKATIDVFLQDENYQTIRFPQEASAFNWPNTGRNKRSVPNKQNIHTHRTSLKLGEDNYVKLLLRKLYHAFLAPSATSRWIEGNITVAKVLPSECLAEAFLDNGSPDTSGLSSVVNICGGLSGVILVNKTDYHIEPLSASSSNHEHVIWSTTAREPQETIQDTDTEAYHHLSPTLNGDSQTNRPLDGSRVHNREKRELFHRNPRHMEILLVADQSLVRFHGRSLVDQYILTQLNIVNTIYHHSSLGVEINIVVVDIVYLTDREKKDIVDDEEGRETLKKFCEWSAKRWHGDYATKFDVAVYLTRENLGPAGYAPVTGMCNPDRSCAVIRDDGISSAFVVAHEIGHIFGMIHDGDGVAEECGNKNGVDGKIMSPTVRSNYNMYHWSNCSRHLLESVLEDMHCLNNEPRRPVWPRYSEPYGQSWTLNEQCRQEFGAGFFHCKAVEHKCQYLWCEQPGQGGLCKTKRSPPLSGTSCGTNMWCLDDHCVSKTRTPLVHGGWSDWSEFGSCSRSCGTGVQYRYRKCDNPIPQYGGRDCTEQGEDFRLCNKQSCPKVTDMREEQCLVYNEVNFYRNKRHNWLPIESTNKSEACKLTCRSEETEDFFTTEKNVIDGTPCSYEDSHDICIQGECNKLGCDGEFDSDLKEDACGVCSGNGSDCRNVTQTYTGYLAKQQYHSILILPKYAMNIKIRESETTPHLAHFLAVRDPITEKFWLNGDEERVANWQFVVHKTRFMYLGKKGRESLKARGPLLAPLEILVYSFSDKLPTEIHYEYFIHKSKEGSTDVAQALGPKAEPGRYRWAVTSYSDCTKPCAGGTHHEQFECMDVVKMTISEGLCERSGRPAGDVMPCNEQPCTDTVYRWETEPWQKCSMTCGMHGIKWRHVFCEARFRDSRRPVDIHYCDDSQRPEATKHCNRMSCPANWVTGGWSQCSVTCGAGEQTRSVYCAKPNDGNKYTCDHIEQPPSLRTCRPKPCPGFETTVASNVEVTSTETVDDSSHNTEDTNDLGSADGEFELGKVASIRDQMELNIKKKRSKRRKRKNRRHKKSRFNKIRNMQYTNDIKPDLDEHEDLDPNLNALASKSIGKGKSKHRAYSKKSEKISQTETFKLGDSPKSSKTQPKDRRSKSKRHKSRKRLTNKFKKPNSIKGSSCSKDKSGLVCKIGANLNNCAKSIYQSLCCKSCKIIMH